MRSKAYRINVAPLTWSRALRKGSMSYDNHTKDQVCFALYLAQQHNEEPMFEKPIHLDITFYMPIPKSPNKKITSKYTTNSPSIDCLYKFFLDSLKDIVITDNRVICALSLKKVYDIEPRTEFTITEV